MRQKPNIVFIMVDQLRYQSLGYAGDEYAQTPNIDEFSEESVNFDQAVASMPVCSATRASLFTGKYTSSTGMVINELRMNPNHRCLAHVLTEVGYRTGYIGKWHLWANQLGRHNKTENAFVPPGPYRLGFDGYWAGYNFHHTYFDTYYFEDAPEKIYYGEDVYEPDAQTDMAMDFISEHSNTDAPFFLFLSYGPPHDPWKKRNVPQKWYKKFKHTQFETPPNYSWRKDPYGDMWANKLHWPRRIRKWKRVYYAMTANLDWNFGRILDHLEQLGVEENTIVIFTSDHGEMFGAHGRMKKNIFYEEASRIPFLMRWPRELPRGLVSDIPFNTPDIMPTLLALVDAPIPEEVEGMDLSAHAKGEEGPTPEAAFLMNTGACAIWRNGHEWRAMRNKNYTYAIYRVDGKELLFDNLKDPYQMHNLTEDPAYKSTLLKFRILLEKKMEELNDTFPPSKWYREHWVEDRIITRTATSEWDEDP